MVILQMDYGTAKDLFFINDSSYFVSGNAFSGGSFSSTGMTDPETLELTYIPDVGLVITFGQDQPLTLDFISN